MDYDQLKEKYIGVTNALLIANRRADTAEAKAERLEEYSNCLAKKHAGLVAELAALRAQMDVGDNEMHYNEWQGRGWVGIDRYIEYCGQRKTRVDLSGVDLSGANLSGANLTRGNLTRGNLTNADLSGANLTGADLPAATLTGANLTRANLTGADLSVVDLTGANLTNADLTRATLICANLTGANRTGAIMTKVKYSH